MYDNVVLKSGVKTGVPVVRGKGYQSEVVIAKGRGGGVWVGAPAWVGGSKVWDPPLL